MRWCCKRGRVLALLVCVAPGACGGVGSGGNQVGGAGGTAGSQPPGAPSAPAAPGRAAAWWRPAARRAWRAGEARAVARSAGTPADSRAPTRAARCRFPRRRAGLHDLRGRDLRQADDLLARRAAGRLRRHGHLRRAARRSPASPARARRAGRITAALLMACVGELGGAACDAFATHGVAACLLKGRRGDGDGCASDFQCASAFCKRTRGINCGSCTPLGRASSPCAESIECGPGLECSLGGACVAPSAPACPAATPSPASSARIAPVRPAPPRSRWPGAACQARDSCAAQKGLVCSQNRCAAIAFARPGQACGGQGILLCEASGDCAAGAGQHGHLLHRGHGRQSCAAGQSCLAPAECLSGICDIPRGTDTGFCN